ncbi:MAG: PepSY-associated TM helix domain-containing protein [Pseudomonadota bacterium]
MIGTSAKKRLIALHGWSATILAILLYVVMLTGTIIVLEDELEHWSKGESERVLPFGQDNFGTIVSDYAATIPQDLREELRIVPTGPDTARLDFAGYKLIEGEREHFHTVFEVHTKTGEQIRKQAGIDGTINYSEPEDYLVRFWYDMHVRLHVPGSLGLYLTGIAGVAMIIAAFTGVLIHRHIIKEMFVTGRPGDRLVSFRDRHNLAGVWSLPFAVLLAFTGTFFSFATSLALPIVAMSAFKGDQEAVIAAVLRPTPPQIEETAELTDLGAVFRLAETEAGTPIVFATVLNWGLANAEITTSHEVGAQHLTQTQLAFNGVNGTLVERITPVGSEPSVGSTLVSLIGPLHFGNFAGLASKAIWVLLGGAMTYTIVTGLHLWLRRRADDPAWRAGSHAMAVTVWGLPLSLVASAYGFFAAGTVGMHVQATVWSFLGMAALSILWGVFAWRQSAEILSKHMKRLLGVSLALLPLVRMATGGMSWGEAVGDGVEAVLLIDILCIGLGIGCVLSTRNQQPVVPEQKAAELAE